MSNGVKRLVELLDERNEHYVVNDLGYRDDDAERVSARESRV